MYELNQTYEVKKDFEQAKIGIKYETKVLDKYKFWEPTVKDLLEGKNKEGDLERAVLQFCDWCNSGCGSCGSCGGGGSGYSGCNACNCCS